MAKDTNTNLEFDFEARLQEALEKQNAEFELKLKQREENLISLGSTVVELIQIDGKPIMDKESGKQKEVNGELAFYPNKYAVKISFNGGEIETPINKNIFDSLELGQRYLAKGRLGEVKEFGNTLMKPIFSQFIKI